jgi:protein SCO1
MSAKPESSLRANTQNRQAETNSHAKSVGAKVGPRARALVWLVVGALSFLASVDGEARQALKEREGLANEVPKELMDLDIQQNLGAKVDIDAPFIDQEGKTVRLRDYMSTGKPVLLSLAYYNCPSLCNFHLNGLNDAFKAMQKPLGDEFNVVIISFDPKEKPELAAAKRESYLKEYGRADGAKGWHFLTGETSSIEPLAKAIGFKYRWDEEQKQYAHAAAAYAISPDGTISRYFFGITFEPKTIRLSMIEASKGQVGNLVDKLTLACFHWDPKEGRFTIAASRVMRAGGVMIILVLGAFLLPFWLRARREQQDT